MIIMKIVIYIYIVINAIVKINYIYNKICDYLNLDCKLIKNYLIRLFLLSEQNIIFFISLSQTVRNILFMAL